MAIDETARLLRELAIQADKYHDGHVTIMKFGTNWKVGFGTRMRTTAIRRKRSP
jgi:hypothetical protein